MLRDETCARNYRQRRWGLWPGGPGGGGGGGEGSLKSAVLDLCLGWENSTLGKWISILVVEATQSVVPIVARRQVGLRLLNLSIDPPRCTGTSTAANSPPSCARVCGCSLCTCDAPEFRSWCAINRIRNIISSCDSVRFVIRINFLLSISSLNDLSSTRKGFQSQCSCATSGFIEKWRELIAGISWCLSCLLRETNLHLEGCTTLFFLLNTSDCTPQKNKLITWFHIVHLDRICSGIFLDR